MLGATPNYRNAQLLRGQPFCPSDKMCPPRSIYHPQLNFNIELTVMVGLSNSLLLSPTAGIFDQFFPSTFGSQQRRSSSLPYLRAGKLPRGYFVGQIIHAPCHVS